ncbi:hypothetical protein PsorP6_001903 [Peronosclerospora sorghi]|uniref:Uncharacterized protein n=1 Tax=Peronosclerospora sorghi TaxID=230839 RepID=A0ACC0WTD6_9STRA|nr:hypothetical protein PsorP6_001903 [Peronosclerospora sorghi]
MTLHPTKYADLLKKKLQEHKTPVYSINTCWTGGVYCVGKHMKLPFTRKCVGAVLDGSITEASFVKDPIFGFEIPTTVKGVPSEILNPRDACDVGGTRSMRLHGFDVYRIMRVRVLHSLHGGQHDEFQHHLRAAWLDIMVPLDAASAELYQRAYTLLHDLHFLHEAEQGFIFLQNVGETEDLGQRSMIWNKQNPSKMRYDSMAMQLKYHDSILALRRLISHEAALRNEVSENLLLYAKLTRKEGYISTTKSAVMHAEALENCYALIEKAKLLVRQYRMYEALQILEPVDIDASTFLDADMQDPRFCAKHLLLDTNIMQQTGQISARNTQEPAHTSPP